MISLLFLSARSMDIEANVYAQSLANETKRLTATSIFTFVSLDMNNHRQLMRPIVVETSLQKLRFAQGLKRFEQQKDTESASRARTIATMWPDVFATMLRLWMLSWSKETLSLSNYAPLVAKNKIAWRSFFFSSCIEPLQEAILNRIKSIDGYKAGLVPCDESKLLIYV